MHKIILFILFGLSTACTVSPEKNTKELPNLEYAGDLLVFSEVMDQREEEMVRMLVTKNYLRIDSGPNAEDYILFDRNKKLIFNVIAEEKSIMQIDTEKFDRSPAYKIRWNVESQTSSALMRSDDNGAASATYYHLKLNDKSCYNIVTVDKGMEEPLAALKEYRESLSHQLKRYYRPDKGQECFEAVNIFTPLHHLHKGFPIREWSAYGYQRFLVDYKKKIIFPKSLFELPIDFIKSKI